MRLLTKNKIVAVCLLLFLLVAGCSIHQQPLPLNEDASSKKLITDEVLITSVAGNEILVGTTYYKITEDTKMMNSQGKRITNHDLQPGDRIRLKDKGFILDSYPGKGEASEVILQTDEASLNVSQSIRHFIENQQLGQIIALRIKEVTQNNITVAFTEFEFTSSKIYEADINRENNKFNVTEIPNEAVLEQERRQNAAIKAGLSGSTAGHITEIYDDGFRVDMVDYTLTEDVVLHTDSGKSLLKDKIEIGNFVRVDYSHYKGDGIVKEARLNQLTLLESEEKPGVQQWIKTVMEGLLYKDPVIMDSHIGIGGNSYTIRVADLQDDTWDSFEVTYDFKTKKQHIERIVHVPQKREVSPYEGITKYEIVQEVNEHDLFISRANYQITPETIMETTNGQKITIKDLEVGNLVELELEHEPTQKFAGSETGTITKVTLQNDERYQDISKSIRHFLTNQQTGSIHSTIISGINDNMIILKFADENNQIYKVRIDRNTDEFTIVKADTDDFY